MATETGGSVTQWIACLKRGDDSAAQRLWERYFERLTRMARGRLAGARGLGGDEEDVALSVFDGLCRAAGAGRFPRLSDRDDLWMLLVTLTVRKAINLRKHAGRQRRGGGRTLDEAALLGQDPWSKVEALGLDAMPGDEPTPEFAAAVAEECRRLLEALDREDPRLDLRRVAVWKLEGYTNGEIAGHLGCALRTVASRLELIRSVWAWSRKP